MKKIYQFIKIICNDLKIKKPKVQIVKSFSNNMQLALYDPKNNVILIKKDYEDKRDLFFAISHELRHKHQLDYHLFDFTNYKSNNEVSTVDYNSQYAEIDANAYAYLIIISVFGVQPLFKGLDQDVINKIKSRAKEISKI